MPGGKHREGYRAPRTGERRRWRQPTAIEKLPAELREAVRNLVKDARAGRCLCRGIKHAHFHPWQEVAELVNRALEQAKAALRVTPSMCQRDYDIFVEQVQAEVAAQAERAKQVAAMFKARGFADLDESALGALAAEVFGAAEARTPQEREQALVNFGLVLAKLMTAQTGQKKVALEKDKLEVAKQRLEQMRTKVGGLKEAVAGKKKVDPKELQKKIDEIYGLTQPNP